MKQIINLFLPSLKSMRSVFTEVDNTSIARERFIDFTKIIGLVLLITNSFTFLKLEESGGELFINNLSGNSQSYIVITWFTAGMSLFFFSMGFNNLIAWYSNVVEMEANGITLLTELIHFLDQCLYGFLQAQ